MVWKTSDSSQAFKLVSHQDKRTFPIKWKAPCILHGNPEPTEVNDRDAVMWAESGFHHPYVIFSYMFH